MQKDNRQAGVQIEIVITPDMIAAGAEVLSLWDLGEHGMPWAMNLAEDVLLAAFSHVQQQPSN